MYAEKEYGFSKTREDLGEMGKKSGNPRAEKHGESRHCCNWHFSVPAGCKLAYRGVGVGISWNFVAVMQHFRASGGRFFVTALAAASAGPFQKCKFFVVFFWEIRYTKEKWEGKREGA